ncbi:hypothetical protein F511_24433 [Dorcoceras hygrometricum]|uniref:Uncharacterized protein n=1 Tax=Dorcoceras hygrometricum TaxID=472368 RepID=A0A2Z7AAD8_9LAMI|nr:hypothetical protein F511_24433 [Dorcoceras hygrometricum]
MVVGPTASCIPEPLRVTQVLDSRFPHGYSAQCVEHEKRIFWECDFLKVNRGQTGQTLTLKHYTRRLPPLKRAAAAARCCRKFVSGQLDEENPFVLISSALLVQPDEGVLVLVVDRIGDNLPQSTEKSRILVIPVGARHKCQQGIVLNAL